MAANWWLVTFVETNILLDRFKEIYIVYPEL